MTATDQLSAGAEPWGPTQTADHRAAHRPLRADHAARGAAGRYGEPSLRVRALRAPAPGRSPVRGGRRRRAGVAGAAALPVRRRIAAVPPRSRGRRRGNRGLAGGLRLPRRHLGLSRGRALLPRISGAGGGEHLRRGGGAGDRAAQHLQPRLGHRVGGIADDGHGGRPAVRRDGFPPHSGTRRRRGGPGRLHRRLRRHLQPGGRTSLRRAHPGHRRPTPSPCCTPPSARRSPPRSPRSARTPPCWWTPTTSSRRSGSGSS